MEDLDPAHHKNHNLKAYNAAKDVWESNSEENSDGILKDALE